MYDLKGKVVLITGGAAGIGFSCVKELLLNGIQGITIADIDNVKGELAIKNLTQEFGPNKAIFVKTDVTKLDQLEAAFKETVKTWKTIDVVINNAGVFNDAQWELEITINSNAVVRGTLLGLQYMGKDKGGKGGVIVNLGSILGLQPGISCPIYTATKHFVIGLSRSLGTAYHYNRTGVKILTICPGVTDTGMPTNAPNFTLPLSPDMGQTLVEEFADLPSQPPESVARAMVTLITKGDNGSVWVAEGDEPVYEVAIPDRRTLRKF